MRVALRTAERTKDQNYDHAPRTKIGFLPLLYFWQIWSRSKDQNYDLQTWETYGIVNQWFSTSICSRIVRISVIKGIELCFKGIHLFIYYSSHCPLITTISTHPQRQIKELRREVLDTNAGKTKVLHLEKCVNCSLF